MKFSKQNCIAVMAILICTLAACGAPPTLPPAPDINALNTIVAMTANNAMTLSAVPGGPVQNQTPTSTFVPGLATLTPTETQLVTSTSIFTATIPAPIISVSVATNCRSGPGKVYPYSGALLVGKAAAILAKDPSSEYWYIPNPDIPGDFCWVWGQYAVILGDISHLPIYTPPPTPTMTFTPLPITPSANAKTTKTPGPSFQISYTGKGSCSGDWWVHIRLDNDGPVEFQSLVIRVWDKNTDTTLSKTTDGFTNTDDCGSTDTRKALPSGASTVVSSHTFGYDLTGHALRVTVKLCTETGQTGVCEQNQLEFAP